MGRQYQRHRLLPCPHCRGRFDMSRREFKVYLQVPVRSVQRLSEMDGFDLRAISANPSVGTSRPRHRGLGGTP
jgi:hypothetical protein